MSPGTALRLIEKVVRNPEHASSEQVEEAFEVLYDFIFIGKVAS